MLGYNIEERFSPWQKKKVRTIVVNGRSKLSSQRSIQNALAQARPYDRIELVGGDYFEALSINMPLELVAAEGEDTRIISRGLCLSVTQGVEAYFEHVEFISKGKGRLEAAVALMHGSSVFFRCKMNSMIIGGIATPHIERCTITESYNGIGIQINDNAGAVLQNCIVHTHNLACVMIDTRGVVRLTENSLYQPVNGGHVLVIRAVQSFATNNEDVPTENLSCRQVTVNRCNLYIMSTAVKVRDREKYSETISGSQSCVVISHGAAPVFTNNELLEGIVGFTFDIAGPAVLRGNKISNQRECGVLVIVDAGNKNDFTRQNLCISGGNLIDRCFIGIDVHCRGRGSSKLVDPMLFSDSLPSSRSSFSWLKELRKICGERKTTLCPTFEVECANLPLRLGGERVILRDLIEDLRELTTLLLAGHPDHFYVESADTRAGGMAMNVFGDLLSESLGAQPPPLNYAAGAEKMLRLRGTCGVDIFETRFASCDLCAIRFGCNGYGLVENCDFMNCGATAIVLHSGAHPVIIGCKLNHSKRAGILIDGLANPLITANEINFGAEYGIEVSNMSRGIIMGNAITSNNSSGICVGGGSSTIIAANLIQSTNMAGVAVAEASKAIILKNKFISNVTCHLLVAEFSNPFIACNHFASSVNAALRFESCGGGTVVDNNIHSNGEGIVVELDADPYVVSNKIINNLRYGILVRNNGLGTFVKNVIKQNSVCNVFIKEGGLPVIRDNYIQEGRGGGVVVAAEGCGYIEHNEISENAMGNVIVVGFFSEPVLTANNISSSASGCGVICARGGGGTFSQNTIFRNFQCGVYVTGKANPTFSENSISREVVGVIVSDSGCGNFIDNEILMSYGAGFIIQLNGDPIVQNNCVSKCANTGLIVASDGRGKISDNKFCENDVGIQLGSSIGTAELDIDVSFFNLSASGEAGGKNNNPPELGEKKTSFKLHLRTPLVVKQQEQRRGSQVPAEIMQNKISHNNMCGVLLDSGASGLLEDNEIESNNLYGVMADVGYSGRRAQEKLKEMNGLRITNLRNPSSGGGTAVIRKNRIFGHSAANVSVLDHPENKITIAENDVYEAPIGFYISKHATISSIRGNTIRNCHDGVVADLGGRGCFEGNTIRDCHGVGVYVSLFANPEFKEGNIIEKCRAAGVFLDAGGKGVFTHTTIRHCLVGVVVYTCPPVSSHARPEDLHHSESVTSAPTFEHCTIERNEHHGVLVLTVSKGFFLRLPEDGSLVRYEKSEGFTSAPDACKFPTFRKNTIRFNRFFGVCHENYEKGDLPHQSYKSGVEVGANKETSHSPFQLREKTGSPGSVALGGKKSNSNENSNPQQTTHTLPEHEQQYQVRSGHLEALGMSTVVDTEEHFEDRIRRQVSFIENTISDCTMGVVIGGNCHPFLLKNRIYKNTFFGLMFRRDSKAACYGCEVSENGVAGLYAAPGSLGCFSGGSLTQNNGFSRFGENPNNPRTFSDSLPLLQARVLSVEIPPKDKNVCDAYGMVVQMMDKYLDVVVDGLRMLFELVASSPAGLSLASALVPNTHAHQAPFTRAMSGEFYHRTWAADGGLGAYIAQGSMIEVSSNTIENNRNAGIFFSRGATHHHKNAMYFIVEPTHGFPTIPVGATVGGRWRNASPRYFFTSAVVSRSAGEMELRKNLPADAKKGSFDAYKLAAEEEAKPVVLRRAAKIKENQVTKNGCGIFVHLFHVMEINKAFESPENALDLEENCGIPRNSSMKSTNKKNRKSTRMGKKKYNQRSVRQVTVSDKVSYANDRDSGCVSGDAGGPIDTFLEVKDSGERTVPGDSSATRAAATAAASQKVAVAAAADPIRGSMDFCVNFGKNQVYSNTIKGVALQHVVEMLCGNSVRSRGSLEAAAKNCQDICAQIMLHREVPKPKIPFTFAPKEDLIQQARFYGNEVYKNPHEQIEITSRYVASLNDGSQILLNIDTLTTLKTSICSSQVLLKDPIFAAFLQHPPPGLFLIEKNRFCEGLTGIRVVGLNGSASSRLRHNVFSEINGDGVIVEGHLASTTVGNGNVFEENNVGVRIVHPHGPISEADLLQQEAIGLTTCIYANRFIASKQASVTVEGLGGIPPLFFGNEFSGHHQGSAAVFIDGPTSKAHIMRNVFQHNYVPCILSNNAGDGEGGSVVLEENRFSRNYIGMFICSGAAPVLMRNVFEGNYRSGMEITGTTTSPIVSNCVFMNNKRSLMPPNLSFPVNGTLCVNGNATFTTASLDENLFVLQDAEKPPSVGITLSGKTRGSVSECLFSGNDLGVDVLSIAFTTEPEVDDVGDLFTEDDQMKGTIRFSSCILTNNLLAGALVRGLPEALSASKTAPERNLTSATSRRLRSTYETAIFDSCFFVSNTCDTESCGDVFSVDGGRALFRKNMFSGCIHGGKEGAAIFLSNTLVSFTLDVAVYMHKATRLQLEANTIRGHKTGIVASPAAWGRLEKNWILDVTCGVIAAPFSHTLFDGNRIMLAKDCGVLAYGGVFADNEISECSKGVVVRNPSEYKQYKSIPASEKSAFSVVIAGNRVHTCDVDGIFVAGGGRILENRVFNCKQNINIMCSRHMDTDSVEATISKNDVYDGEIGILVSKGCAASIRENDVFDNSVLGVWCKPGSSGVLQGNNISIARKEGAIHVQESEVKVLQNTIRNQFSPSYHKTLPPQRVKERQEAGERLSSDIRHLSTLIEASQRNCEAVGKLLRAFLDGMMCLEGSSDSISDVTLADSISKSLYHTAKESTDMVAEHLNMSMNASRRSVDLLCGGRIDGFIAPGALQRISIDRRTSDSILSSSQNLLTYVLIHVLSEEENSADSMQMAKQIEAIFFANPLVSRALFRTVLTTNSSALEEFLSSQVPHVFVLVVGIGKQGMSEGEIKSLQQIDRSKGSGAKVKDEEGHISRIFTLLPRKWNAKLDQLGRSGLETNGFDMTIEKFAARHVYIFFEHSLFEAVSALKEQLLVEFPDSSGRPNVSKRSVSESTGDPQNSTTAFTQGRVSSAQHSRFAPLPLVSSEPEKGSVSPAPGSLGGTQIGFKEKPNLVSAPQEGQSSDSLDGSLPVVKSRNYN